MKYMIMKEGDGKVAKRGRRVSVHYVGRLVQGGKVFDSNTEGQKPFQFKLGKGQVIKGWDLAVAKMRVGESRKVIIPPHLAYGQRGAGRDIPGNAWLEFDIQLLSVK